MMTCMVDRNFRTDLRFFAFYVGNGSLLDDHDEFDDIEYRDLFASPGDALGHLFAVYLNNKRIQLYSEQRTRLAEPEERAVQWVLSQCRENYTVIPPFATWEVVIDTNPSDLIGAISLFALTLGRGDLESSILGQINYLPHLFMGGSLLEMLFAIFGNVLRIDDQQHVTNQAYATRRAAQYLRHERDPLFDITPPFAAWETELFLWEDS